jgi:hypothetical protein
MLCSKGARTFPVPFAKKKKIHSTLKKTESYTRSSMHESITFLVWSSNLQAFGALKKDVYRLRSTSLVIFFR